VDPQMSPWDIAALIPILREAGASCTDWQGDEIISTGEGVSIAPGLKAVVIELLRDVPPLNN
jgi:myo-inositol-1(or 4)-monophosphatase